MVSYFVITSSVTSVGRADSSSLILSNFFTDFVLAVCYSVALKAVGWEYQYVEKVSVSLDLLMSSLSAA